MNEIYSNLASDPNGYEVLWDYCLEYGICLGCLIMRSISPDARSGSTYHRRSHVDGYVVSGSRDGDYTSATLARWGSLSHGNRIKSEVRS